MTKHQFTGGSNTMEGCVILSGTQTLDITGGGASAPCTQIIAYFIDFTMGAGTVGSNCANAGVTAIGGQAAGLVE